MRFCIMVILMICSFLAFVSTVPADETEQQKMLRKQVEGFTLDKARITDFGRQLSIASGLSVCVEEARLFPGKGDPDSIIAALKAAREKGLTFSVSAGTVQDAIDALLGRDGRYTLAVDTVAGIINVYPKESSPLGWHTDSIKFKNSTLMDIFANDLLHLKNKGIIFDPGFGNHSWLETEISFDSGPISAREAINVMCSTLDFHARWEVFEIAPVDGDVKRILRFHGINPASAERNENEEAREK